MTYYTRITQTRLKLVFKRQANPTWDADYIPGILATRGEAPSISNASILQSGQLSRPVHTLSKGERAFAILGLYVPNTVGLQEQRMIPGHNVPHPLAAWPEADSIMLPLLKGLEELAAELGFERYLRAITVDRANGAQCKVTCPWFGDLLWAIRDNCGKVFCVNWTIKDTQSAFRRRKKGFATAEQLDDERAVIRLAGERAHYKSAGIRTCQLAHEDLPRELEANLLQLFLHHARPNALTEGQQKELHEKLQAALELGVPPTEVITRFRGRHQVAVHEPRSYFYQLVWERRLMVDLFRPLLIDRPMRAMDKDPIEVFADWFKPEGGEQ